MPNSIKKTVHSTVTKLSLFDLFTDYNDGIIITYNKWLQRLSQKKTWTAKQYKKAKEYIHHLIHGSANVQAFLLADIESLISTAEAQARKETGQVSLIFIQILEDLKVLKSKGVLYIILDGQNRLEYGIKPFFKNLMSIQINTDNNILTNIFFKNLEKEIQDEIKKIEVYVCRVKADDISHILSTLQAINLGEPWTPHERRSVLFTPVAFEMQRLSCDTVVFETCKKLSNILFNTKDYSLEKKGDTLLFAEFLHFLDKGNFGNDKSLDTLYNIIDISIDKNIKMLKNILMFMCQTCNNNPTLIEKIKSKTYFINMFIILNMLVNKNARNGGLMKYNFTIETGKIVQIKSAKAFFDEVFDLFTELKADISQYEYERDENGNVKIDTKTKLPKINRKLAKAGTWALHNNGSDQIDLEARERIIASKINSILDKMYDEGLILIDHPRKIDALTEAQLYAKTKIDEFSRYGEPISFISKKEIDHIKPVSKGGDNSLENLVLTSRENNRNKAAR